MPIRSSFRGRWAALLVAAAVAAGCGGGTADSASTRATSTSTSSSSSTSSSTSTTAVVTTAAAPPSTVTKTTVPRAPTTTAPATTTSTHPHPARHVDVQSWVPYATVGPLTLHLPGDHVEAIGFHQSGNDGALAQTALPTAPRWFVMGDRDRDTNPKGAADIVVEPGREVRAPVTGTVIRAASYTLYCDTTDWVVVINPDDHPGWEVKVLHIQGLAVVKGQRVEAGVTRIAEHAHVLPFASQVEEDTGLPPWPHVHVEVVDPSIPDRPGEPCP